MPIPRRDFFDFLFNDGRRIRRDQLTLDTGIPDYYLGVLAYDAAANTLTGDVSGVANDDVADLAFFHMTLPLDINPGERCPDDFDCRPVYPAFTRREATA